MHSIYKSQMTKHYSKINRILSKIIVIEILVIHESLKEMGPYLS